MNKILVITMPADDLVPLVARPSAGPVLNSKFEHDIFNGSLPIYDVAFSFADQMKFLIHNFYVL